MSTNFDKIVHRWMRNEKMSGYIKKSTLAEELLNLAIAGKDKIKISSVINMIEGLPPADVVPVAHGRWRIIRIIKEAPIARKFIPFNELTELDLLNECRCSRCGFNCSIGVGQSHLANYCPNCGARMDGGENND